MRLISNGFKRNLRNYLSKNKTLHKYILMNDSRKISKSLKDKTPIFIYQMGKVASSSIFDSVNEYNNFDGTVFHAHHFESPHSYNPRIGLFYDYYYKEKPPIKIISLIREPIGRNISGFFQNIKYYADVDKISNNEYKAEELQEIFLSKSDHSIPLTWFDKQLKHNFNIDVYQYNFPKDKYQIIKKGRVELLLMRHDLEDKYKEIAIMKFLSISNFELKKTNVGSHKFYNKAYKEMKDLIYPKWYIDKMLNSKYVLHFYRNEIKQLSSKWENNA